MGIKEKLKDFFDGKSVVILGFGREGKSTLKLLKELDCCTCIAIADMNEIDPAEAEGCTLHCGSDYLSAIGDYDIIMKAPGIGLKNYVSDEIKAKITCQTDLFLRFCDTPIIGVTGTKGKSTVSSLIYHFVTVCEKESMLIGNIGVPPLERADEFADMDVIVCELSCHQLEYVKASPNIAILLNIYPEHLDHYVDFEAYTAAKSNIFRYQKEGDTLIINDTLNDTLMADTPAKVVEAGVGIGHIGVWGGGVYMFDTYYSGDKIKTKLRGEHNLYNISIALYAAQLVGCDTDFCVLSLMMFKPLEHRLEYVCKLGGAEYINDSISTAPETAVAALKAYPDTDTLIIGGMDRGISYKPLGDYLNADTSVRNLIILPDSGIRAAKEVTNPQILKMFAKDMEEAVALAKEHTKVRCILSPAAASYGFYKNFEERGRHFKSLLGHGE
ncbi:MAG: UDP-N-acetylmuramoyl-L-alanine--D-glutamate ligase [Eubacterium sp.]|nr:UDP-N-acetylmuramoyl-L-alanine--D-glutamate ligase [Eubacterium sp.]